MHAEIRNILLETPGLKGREIAKRLGVQRKDVDKIRWLYTLKPSTINIAPYNDSQREYPEIAVMQVELSRTERVMRIAHFINRSIPYPLVLLFTCDIEGQASLAIGLADKRINQADKEKWVIVDSIQTDWFDLSDQSKAVAEFLASHSGAFFPGDNNQTTTANDKLAMLRELEKLEAERSEVSNKLKKEKQMGRQVEMNTYVKDINEKIARIKGKL